MHIIYSSTFKTQVKHIDAQLKTKLRKILKKIVANPSIGKPLKYNLKGERCVRIKPFRILYAYKNDTLYLLTLSHRSDAYHQ